MTWTVTKHPRRHTWATWLTLNGEAVERCKVCGQIRDLEASRRGRSSRRLGNDQERRAEKVYGWEKVGEAGGPDDLSGRLVVVQQKATRRAPPLAWKQIFGRLDDRAQGRTPLLLLSFVKAGVATEDFVVIRGADWLALVGRDE